MLRFKNFILEQELLAENRVQWLKDNMKDVDTSHDSLSTHHNTPDIIDHFANNADPSRNKQHTQWFMNQYKNKAIRQEDAPRIHSTLSTFDKHKGKLDRKNISDYGSLYELETAVEPHKGAVASNKEQKRLDKADAETVHDKNGLLVKNIKSPEAAIHYGKGTKWCTSSKDLSANPTKDYLKQGPIYYVQAKDEHGKPEKYQFHGESNQYMDSEDKPVSLHHLANKHPELKNVDEFKNNLPAFYSEDKIKKMMNGSSEDRYKASDALRHNVNLSDDYQHELGSKYPSALAENSGLNKNTAMHLMYMTNSSSLHTALAENSPHEEVQNHIFEKYKDENSRYGKIKDLLNNPKLHPNVANKMLDHFKSQIDTHPGELANNATNNVQHMIRFGNLNKDQHEHILKNFNKDNENHRDVRDTLYNRGKLHPDTIKDILADKYHSNYQEKHYVLRTQNLPKDTQHNLLDKFQAMPEDETETRDSPKRMLRSNISSMMGNSSLHKEVQHRILNDPKLSHSFMAAMGGNSNLDKETQHKMMNMYDTTHRYNYKASFLKNPKLHPEVQQRAYDSVDDPNEKYPYKNEEMRKYNREDLSRNDNLHKSLIDKLIKEPKYHHPLAYNDNLTPEHIKYMEHFHKTSPNEESDDVLDRLRNHPANQQD
jgi:hypothetical protein